MWIKICGITSVEDAEVAIAAGADAIGFVFAESPRRVNPEVVRDIVGKLPQSIEKIGVFVDASLDEVAAAYRIAGLTGVQLHGANREASSLNLQKNSGPLRVIHVVRYSGDSSRFALELRELHENFDVDENAVLVDSCIAGKQGGTGLAFDWSTARDSFLQESPNLRLIAAGGLRPDNVEEAIHTLRPWGVDVSSGVEASPGRKDPNRVKAFVRNARQAGSEQSRQNPA